MEDELNDHVQEAIRRKEWSIVSLNLEENPEDLSRETFKMLAVVFDELSLKRTEENLRKHHLGRPSEDIRNGLMIAEYREMLAAPSKGSTSPAQHKAQARKATARKFKVSERAFDKILERFERKELLTAQSITNGVDVKALLAVADEIDVGLQAEGLDPGTGHKIAEWAKFQHDIVERGKLKKRRKNSS